MGMFDKYNEVGEVPNNLSAPSNCHLAPRIPGKPFEIINYAGELVGYYWYYGTTLKLEFTINGEVVDDYGNYISAKDYLDDSTFSVKSIKFRLFDFRHEEIYSKEFVDVKTNVITIDINQELSNKLLPGIYYCSLELIDDMYPEVITLFGQDFCTLTVKEGGFMEIKLNAKLSAYSNVNLKKLAEHSYLYYGTLTTNWIGTQAPYTQRIFVDGLLATDDPMAIVDIVLSNNWELAVDEDQQWSNIKKITIEDNAVVAYSETPIEIPINMVIKVTR